MLLNHTYEANFVDSNGNLGAKLQPHQSNAIHTHQGGDTRKGAIDTASLLNINLIWKRFEEDQTDLMAQSILDAVTYGNVDGIITTIPNLQVANAIASVRALRLPVIIFELGESYASELGLARVLTSDEILGKAIAQQLLERGYSHPLVISPSPLGNVNAEGRYAAIRTTIRNPLHGFLQVSNSTSAVDDVVHNFSKGAYDSMIAIGGVAASNSVAGALMNMSGVHNGKRIGAGFVDLDGEDLDVVFNSFPDTTVGISQLPYYQSALPVVYLYLQYLTSFDVYGNQTIPTGPIVITNSNLNTTESGRDRQGFLLHPNRRNNTVGVIIPNSLGDSYGRNILSGIQQLANKISWNIFTNTSGDYIGYPEKLMSSVTNFLSNPNVDGIVLLSSHPYVNNYTITKSTEENVPVSIIGTFFEELIIPENSSRIFNPYLDTMDLAAMTAQMLLDNGFKNPVCFGDGRPWKNTTFCDILYRTLLQTFPGPIPPEQLVVNTIDISSQSNVNGMVNSIMSNLSNGSYDVDSVVTFSEYIFNAIILDSVVDPKQAGETAFYTASDLFQQQRSLMLNRVQMSLDSYELGFLSLFNILLSNSLSVQPWNSVGVRADPQPFMCPPGTHYSILASSSYCMTPSHDAIRSIQCIPCSDNFISASSDQPSCLPCSPGTLANALRTECLSCNDQRVYQDSYCQQFLTEDHDRKNRVILSIVLPIVFGLLAVISFYFLWRYWRRQHKADLTGGNDSDNWLLSYSHLTHPSMRYMMLDHPNSMTDKPGSTRSISLCNEIADQQDSAYENLKEEVPHWALQDTKNNQTQTEVARANQLNANNNRLSMLITRSRAPHTESFHNAIGIHRNLKVFIRQIGFKQLHLKDDIRKEIGLLKHCRSANLVEFIGVCIETRGTYIVEEYCNKGTLFDILANDDYCLTWIFQFSMINDLVEGMRFIHRSKISLHGLLTSASCYVTNKWELKICDFGLHKVRQSMYDQAVIQRLQKQGCSNGIILPNTVTMRWMAPESIVNVASGLDITMPSKKADIYRQEGFKAIETIADPLFSF
ncbi:hypothetical protein DM01DRAFT_357356 [Hesseltinella vesiculosa]|uniref:guanylate cyclase n=1 Tax=Hesseltinella vesiculosa TaxID=101127 RepID=A0A1X2GAX9_9FUNG|nr:hypothetical protein DM01DRAFT_357356 [Hesseltinella vesiculosa]